MILTINSLPYIGCEDVYCYRVGTDTETDYTIGGTDSKVLKIPELVAISYNVSANDSSYYANNVKKLTDTTFTPTASMTLSGDSEETDKMLFGKTADGAALLDNFDAVPECGIFYVINRAKGQWTIRHIPKATCSKGDSTVDTKGENTSFQTAVTNINPLYSNYFKTYTREFYSENPVFEGHTFAEVLEALAANPKENFESWPAAEEGV